MKQRKRHKETYQNNEQTENQGGRKAKIDKRREKSGQGHKDTYKHTELTQRSRKADKQINRDKKKEKKMLVKEEKYEQT